MTEGGEVAAAAPLGRRAATKARTREALLEAARRVFAERGYGPASVEEIAKTAGVSVGSVYVHFASKEALFTALVEDQTSVAVDLKSTIVGFDGVFKYAGFFGTGEYFWRERTPETGSKFDASGWFVQAGQMLNKRRSVEAAFRYGSREVSDLVSNSDVDEIRGGLSYYYRRHSLKLQADFGQVETGLGAAGGNRKDKEFRLQTQFIF